jgi:hypothetical protein
MDAGARGQFSEETFDGFAGRAERGPTLDGFKANGRTVAGFEPGVNPSEENRWMDRLPRAGARRKKLPDAGEGIDLFFAGVDDGHEKISLAGLWLPSQTRLEVERQTPNYET